eukprot:GFUD01073535.1.p1 GENE.GFUD01073535.1~~GFUD01073535.1.p1  ORF type:complete len:113 (+),score=13.20 GFUD01073535.1:132-470(+)
MVKVLEKNMNEVVRCRITGNAAYNPASAMIIARNGYIQRFSYNCTQYARNGLKKTGFFDTPNSMPLHHFPSNSTSMTSITSVTSLGSSVIVLLTVHSSLTGNNANTGFTERN